MRQNKTELPYKMDIQFFGEDEITSTPDTKDTLESTGTDETGKKLVEQEVVNKTVQTVKAKANDKIKKVEEEKLALEERIKKLEERDLERELVTKTKEKVAKEKFNSLLKKTLDDNIDPSLIEDANNLIQIKLQDENIASMTSTEINTLVKDLTKRIPGLAKANVGSSTLNKLDVKAITNKGTKDIPNTSETKDFYIMVGNTKIQYNAEEGSKLPLEFRQKLKKN